MTMAGKRKQKHMGHNMMKHDRKGGKRTSGALGKGMRARGVGTGKTKGHGGGKSVAKPGGKVGTHPSGHDATFGRGAETSGPKEAKLGRGGTKLGQDRKSSTEKRLQDQFL